MTTQNRRTTPQEPKKSIEPFWFTKILEDYDEEKRELKKTCNTIKKELEQKTQFLEHYDYYKAAERELARNIAQARKDGIKI